MCVCVCVHAHRHRLGVNYQKFPVNCPYATRVRNYQRDGPAVVDGNQRGAPNYFPNSFEGPQPAPALAAPHVVRASGDIARVETGDDDNFSQCREFFRRVLSQAERERLTDNIAGALSGALKRIQQRALVNFEQVDPEYARMIARKIEVINAKKKNQNQGPQRSAGCPHAMRAKL